MPRRPTPPSDLLYKRFRRELDLELERRYLGAWMRKHRTEVAALLAEGEMDLEAAARHFAAAGLLVNGQTPDAGTAEETWRRMRPRRR